MMKLTQTDIDEAMAMAKTVTKKPNPFERAIVSEEFEIKRHARNFCVKKFFENVDIVVILNNIKPEFFS